MNIAQSMYEWLSNILFGIVTDNIWYTQNRDTIIGIFLVVMCSLVIIIALWLVVSVMRFLGRCLDITRW